MSQISSLSPFAFKVIKIMLQALNEYLGNIISMIQANFRGMAVTVTTLWIVYCCWKGFWGEGGKKLIQELFLSALILVSIVSAVLSGDFYLSCVKGFITYILNTCSWFASFGSVNNFFEIFDKLDDGFVLVKNTIFAQVPNGTFLTNADEYVKAWVAIGVICFSYGLMYVGFLFMIIFSFFSLYILFTLGIPCIFLGSFQITRHFFWAWSKAILKYCLIMIFASITMSIGYAGIDLALKIYANSTAGVEIFNSGFCAVVVWSLVCFFLLLKSSDKAAELSGGSPESTTGVGAVMGLMAGGAMLAYNKLGGPTANISKKLGGMGYEAVRDKWLRRGGE